MARRAHIIVWSSTLFLLVSCGTSPSDQRWTDLEDVGEGGDIPHIDDATEHGDDGSQVAQCTSEDILDLSSLPLERTLESASTEFSVRLQTFTCPALPTEFVFRVDLTNHTGDISGFDNDLDTSARLATDKDVVVTEGFVYEVLSADDHHPAGLLRAPASLDGQPVVGCDTGELRLELVGVTVSAEDALTFSWTGEVLDLLRDCS
ncbi:MAG: hypothetical protein ACNA8W_21520 [Bradymonadaceae bacterium]